MGNTVIQPIQNTLSGGSEALDDINEYDVDGYGDECQGFVGEDGDEGDKRYNITGDQTYYGGLGQRKKVHTSTKYPVIEANEDTYTV